jgi:hypothetical protein
MRFVVRSRIPAEQCAKWKGRHAEHDHYDIVIDGSAEVYGPDGKLLLNVLRGDVDKSIADGCYETYHWLRQFKSDNRATYAGYKAGKMILKDGTLSKSGRAIDENGNRVKVSSVIGGYFEPQGGRNPFCRPAQITHRYPEEWSRLVPLLQECAKHYRINAPIRYKKHKECVDKTHPAWIIPKTPFSSITVNNTVAAAYHQDGGDLKDGMGCMYVYKRGEYDGFQLVVPEYRIAINMRDNDLLLFDPRVWHGSIKPYNTVGEEQEDWERISIVMYFREGLMGRKSPAEEHRIAKERGLLIGEE